MPLYKVACLQIDSTELVYRQEIDLSALNTFFDNTSTGVAFDTVQAVLDDLLINGGQGATPGGSFGRGGNSSAITWLYRDGGVPSNRTGRPIALYNCSIKQITIACEDLATCDVTFYSHEGDEINLTTLGTVQLVNSRGDTYDIDFPVGTGLQLAVAITAGSARNVGVDYQLKGTLEAP